MSEGLPSDAPSPVGAAAHLVLFTECAIYRVDACVRSAEEETVLLRPSSPFRRVIARAHPRFECSLSGAWRTVRDDGSTAPWRAGTVLDISEGGARLHLDATLEPPRQMMLLFSLPDSPQPIKAKARLAHWHRDELGEMVMGVCFTAVSPQDRLKLHRFIRDRLVPGSG